MNLVDYVSYNISWYFKDQLLKNEMDSRKDMF
jgi:hypothetical protein